MNLDHLSYSSISSYLSCAAAWKFKYVDKITTPTSPELAFGSAFHSTVEQHLQGEGDLLPLWQKNWSVQLEKQQINFGSDTVESFANEGIRLFTNPDILNGILSIKPGKDEVGYQIERQVILRVPNVSIPIVGYIDVITQDGVPGDLKTSGKSWSPEKAYSETQPLFYLAALNQAGVKIDWHFKHYVFVKTKTPQFQIHEHIHKPTEVMWLFQMIQNVWKGIESGVYPQNPTSWKCSPNYCEFWAYCRGKYEA